MVARKKFRQAAGGVLGIAALGAAAYGVVQLSPLTEARAEGGSGVLTTTEASGYTDAFAAPQTPADRLPSFLLSGPQKLDNLVATTTRALGADGDTKVWTALNTDREACLISLLPGPDEWASMTCASPDEFRAHALSLQAATKTASSRVYFVPAGFNTPEGFTRVAPQLLTSDPTVTQTKPVTLTKSAAAQSRAATSTPATIEIPPFDSVEGLK